MPELDPGAVIVMQKPINLAQRMLAITQECKSIKKEGRNEAQGYNYIRAVDVVDEVGHQMVKHGVALYLSDKITERKREDTQNKDGKTRTTYHVCLSCEATFVNVDDQTDKITVSYASIGCDQSDKDIYKAKTSGLKYLLTQTFLVVTELLKDVEDDSEKVTGEVKGRISRAKKNKEFNKDVSKQASIINRELTFKKGQYAGKTFKEVGVENLKKFYEEESGKEHNKKAQDFLDEVFYFITANDKPPF